MTACPTLTTERLTLRPHRRADYDTFAAFYTTERSQMVGGPLPATTVWYGFCSDAAHWSLMGFGHWAIERVSDGAFMGQIGLQHPPHYPEREFGWILFADYEGQGYAHEAAAAVRDWTFGTLGWSDMVSYIDPANARSIRLAERRGAVRDEAAPAYDEGDLVYRHHAEGRA